MNIRQSLSIVPKAVRIWALVIGGCALLAGLGVGLHEAQRGPALRSMFMYTGAGVFGGVMIAAWLLCLGFVFADARRRAMRPFLWVLVAALFPHLLGFLLYFVMRQPIASPCSHCGQTIPLNQRFCSWCGSPQPGPAAGNAPPGPRSSGLDPMTTA